MGAEELEKDEEGYEEKMLRQFAESTKLEAIIRKNLRELGCGG